MVNYKVTLREREPDEHGRKNTKRVVIRERSRLDALTKAMKDYPGMRVVSIEAQDGSE